MKRFWMSALAGGVLGLALAPLAGVGVLGASAQAAEVAAHVRAITASGEGAELGLIRFTDSANGARISWDLKGLPPGPHGFHVHDKSSCAAAPGKDGQLMAGGAAGGHFDPSASGKHLGPEGAGHLGDLPFLAIGPEGAGKGEALAPHISSVAALKGHAVIIHLGADNYADQPAPLGGGGARIACGVLE